MTSRLYHVLETIEIRNMNNLKIYIFVPFPVPVKLKLQMD